MDASSLDRRTLVATIRDYVEQLREEGMEGLPASHLRYTCGSVRAGARGHEGGRCVDID